MNAPAQQPKTELAVFHSQLTKMEDQIAPSLPSHIKPQAFVNAIKTAVNNNPDLMKVDRKSLLTACMRAAQDGLLPDGRDGAIVVRWDRNAVNNKAAAWQPMIAGIRKKARNSGEIATWDVDVVCENDQFEIEKGDSPRIYHVPAMKNRGGIVGAYSVVTLKSGEKSREFMTIEEIHEIRDTYSDGWKAFKADKIKSTPWQSSPGEMAKKTVARRHSKVIPMSTDLMAILLRSDEDSAGAIAGSHQPAQAPRSLTQRFDALAGVSSDPETGEILDNGSSIEDSDPNSQAGSDAAGITDDPSDAAGKDAEASPSHEAPASKPKPEAKAEKVKPNDARTELLRRADEAASRGSEDLAEFMKKLSKAERSAITFDDTEKLRATAKQMDEANAE